MVASGGVLVAAEIALSRFSDAISQGNLFGDDTDVDPGADIEGPLNMLLIGVDTRPSRPEEPALADAMLVLHVPAGLDRGYLISLPRDSLVEIPPFPETGFPGAFDAKLTEAMSHGSRQQPGEELPDLERGNRLLAQTIGDLTGIQDFAAGAVIKFEGFVGIVDALGGITVELDEAIVSRHRQPDGTHRPVGCGGYCGPQMVYEPGVPPCDPAPQEGASFTCDLEGWHALDIARQRYGVTDGDFGRQRNQQMILMAMLEQALSRDTLTNPVQADRVLQAAGDALVFDGRGREPIDFAFAMRDMRPANLSTITLPTESIGEGDGYVGEQWLPEAFALFDALAAGQIDQFLLEHPGFVD